jgi:hypothetical protein
MPKKSEFKVFSGTALQLTQQIHVDAHDGWRPILLSSAGTSGAGIAVVVIFERVIGD